MWVDPRSRGEDLPIARRRPLAAGRSPLTRGRPRSVPGRAGAPGSIPAHAGKTSSRAASSCRRRVDPRSRGEDSALDMRWCGPGGRSPLTRGRQPRGNPDPHRGRSIPAHAGKTRSHDAGSDTLRVDPRSRGEDRGNGGDCWLWPGRSPLTRGRRRGGDPCAEGEGSIPAHAGKTSAARHHDATAGVDPRSRGEDAWSASRAMLCTGRSPLTRGRLHVPGCP